MKRIVGVGMLAALGCGAPVDPAGAVMDRVAEAYVKVALGVGVHDGDFVDAFYGPPAWRAEADSLRRPLTELRGEAAALLDTLRAHPVTDTATMLRLRHSYLTRQLEALLFRVDLVGGARQGFDAETQALYAVTAPTRDSSWFEERLARLDTLLPGRGSVRDRYVAYRAGFVIPPEKVDTVFRAALAECRARTAPHLTLPAGETFTIEYVTGKPWSGYNWYQGNATSLIQVNTDLPIYIDRAVDLACHEGYPGHHVYNAMLEAALVRGRGWVEYSVYPLFSPQSFIAEGTANYGIDMAFPGAEKAAFERDVLYPLAGLDPAGAEQYAAIQALVGDLNYARNEAARHYLEGTRTGEQAIEWMMRYELRTRASAEQSLRFIDQYRSYVINYNLGRDLVAEYVERVGGADPASRWRVFTELLSSPRLAPDLVQP